MSITYVTAIYNISAKEDREKNILENFYELCDSGIEILVYTDDYFYNLIDQEKIGENVTVFSLSSDKLEIYSAFINKREILQLPSNRNIEKDTLEFMALMNTKIEFVYRSLNLINTEYISWLDCGLVKIFKDKKNSLKYLSGLKINKLENILIPGAYRGDLSKISEQTLFNNVIWIFLGGFFICNRNIVKRFYDLSLEAVNNMIDKKIIYWEVNTWIEVAKKDPTLFEWYVADHNDSIIRIPAQFKQEEEISESERALFEKKNRVITLRTESKHQEVYELAREILQEEKNPFSSTFEDLSISCFYLDRKKEGKIALERVLFSSSPNNSQNKQGALQNLPFYIDKINICKKWEFNYLLPYGYFPSSPSIYRLDDGSYIYNIRAVNYTIESNGSYNIRDPNQIVRTKNFILNMDKDFNIISEFQLSDDLSILKEKYESRIKGLEDIRLFIDKNGNKYFFATCVETFKEFVPRIVFGGFEDGGKLLFVKKLDIPGMQNNTCEKNWLPFVTDDNEIRFIYTHSPLTIYSVDRETYECRLVHKLIEKDFESYEFRGSAPPIKFNGGWLLTIHQVLYSTPRKYYHRFVWYDSEFKERKLVHCSILRKSVLSIT